jgi:hypothetical protein
MAVGIDLTGAWAGYYSQNDRRTAVTAELTQTGDVLAGVMRDAEVITELTLFEGAQMSGLPPGADEQIERQLREQFPDARGHPVRYYAELPPTAAVRGQVKGWKVTFEKRYEGPHRVGWKVGPYFVGNELELHVVHYDGWLAVDGTRIEGHWRIPADPATGSPALFGGFELRREAS